MIYRNGTENRGERVLVLGSDTRSLIAVIRSLGREGIQVHAVCTDPLSPALKSRYLSEEHNLPDFSLDKAAWFQALDGLLHARNFDLVIPCDDPFILRLAAYRDSGGGGAPLELLSKDLWSVASSKQKCHEIAANIGAPIARSELIGSLPELEAALRLTVPPYVLKPISSFGDEDTIHRRAVRKAFSLEQALLLGSSMLEVSPLQLQENFIGAGTGVEFLASNGSILTAFQHLRLHEPIHGGGSSYRTGIALHTKMYAIAEAMVSKLAYDGVGMIEFKWNRATGEFIFIELNARFWGSLPLAIASGANFPWFLYRHRKFGHRDFPKEFRTGLYCRNWTQDIDWLSTNARSNRRDPLLASLTWPTVFKEARNLLLGRERIDTFSLDDPIPFIRELLQLGAAKVNALRRTTWRRTVGSTWLRPLMALRLRKRLRHARSIEFVCSGNICRSPFAERLARQLKAIGKIKAEMNSSGLHETTGRSSPALAIATARNFGVDLSDHSSARLNAQRVGTADLIFVFDWSNYDRLLTQFPHAKSKVFLIGLLDSERPLDVMDPWGGSAEDFHHVYRRLTHVLRRISQAN